MAGDGACQAREKKALMPQIKCGEDSEYSEDSNFFYRVARTLECRLLRADIGVQVRCPVPRSEWFRGAWRTAAFLLSEPLRHRHGSNHGLHSCAASVRWNRLFTEVSGTFRGAAVPRAGARRCKGGPLLAPSSGRKLRRREARQQTAGDGQSIDGCAAARAPGCRISFDLLQ